jgi:hypothetical protein
MLERRSYLVRRLREIVGKASPNEIHLFDGFEVICKDDACDRVYEDGTIMKDPTHLRKEVVLELVPSFREMAHRIAMLPTD